MPAPGPPPDWLERANRLATLARQLSTTVHDVNNALQVISGNAEMLEAAAGGTEAAARRAGAIRTHARRASGMLTELMAFAGDTSEAIERAGLRQSAERALAMRHYSLKKLRVDVAVEGDEVIVDAIPRLLLQMLLNLIVNAEQAMAGRTASRLRLRVSTTGDLAELVVEDNGPGMGVDLDAGSFDEPLDYDARADGLGIGVRVAMGLAERQGGVLTCRPTEGGGCTFTLSMPTAR